MDNIFAQRLVNARKMKGMSQRELSNAAGGQVSPTAITKYEKGLMIPSGSALLYFAKALGMNTDYFFRPFTVPINIDKFEFLKHSGLKGKKEEAVKHLICSEIEKYIEIETILGINEIFSIDYKDTAVKNEQDAKDPAIRFRQDMKLGHLLLSFSDDADAEKLCTVFANEILIPSEIFKAMIGESRHDISLVELQAVQKDFGISVDALMAKAAALNIISQKRYVTYHKKKNLYPKLKEEIEKSLYHKEHITHRFERPVYSAPAREMVSYSKAAALLDTSVTNVRERVNLM